MRTTFLAVVLSLGGASVAQAQYYGTPRIGGGYAPGGYFGGGSFGGGSFGAGYSAPFSGFGLGYSSYPAGFGINGPTILPGFGAATSPRMRPTVYPAIPLPTNEVIAAQLAGSDENRATLNLRVPTTNARVFIEGVQMTQSGTQRQFVTPALEPGSYQTQVRVEWDTERGQQSRLRTITLSPGTERTVTIR